MNMMSDSKDVLLATYKIQVQVQVQARVQVSVACFMYILHNTYVVRGS